jgi:hypothetical protein
VIIPSYPLSLLGEGRVRVSGSLPRVFVSFLFFNENEYPPVRKGITMQATADDLVLEEGRPLRIFLHSNFKRLPVARLPVKQLPVALPYSTNATISVKSVKSVKICGLPINIFSFLLPPCYN